MLALSLLFFVAFAPFSLQLNLRQTKDEFGSTQQVNFGSKGFMQPTFDPVMALYLESSPCKCCRWKDVTVSISKVMHMEDEIKRHRLKPSFTFDSCTGPPASASDSFWLCMDFSLSFRFFSFFSFLRLGFLSEDLLDAGLLLTLQHDTRNSSCEWAIEESIG